MRHSMSQRHRRCGKALPRIRSAVLAAAAAAANALP